MNFFNKYIQHNDLPEYTGKNIFYTASLYIRIISIIMFFIMSSPILIISIFILINSGWNAAVGLFVFEIFIVAQFGIMASASYRKIIVSKTDITLLNIFNKTIRRFDWDNIEHIHVMVSSTTLKSQTKFYISTDPMKFDGLGRYSATRVEYIIAYARPEIIHCIMKYYNGKIDNTEEIRNWTKYISKL